MIKVITLLRFFKMYILALIVISLPNTNSISAQTSKIIGSVVEYFGNDPLPGITTKIRYDGGSRVTCKIIIISGHYKTEYGIIHFKIN